MPPGSAATLVPVRLLSRKAALAPQALGGRRWGDVELRDDAREHRQESPPPPPSPLPPLPLAQRRLLSELEDGRMLAPFPQAPLQDLVLDDTPTEWTAVEIPTAPPGLVMQKPRKPRLQAFSLSKSGNTAFRDWKRAGKGSPAAAPAPPPAEPEEAFSLDGPGAELSEVVTGVLRSLALDDFAPPRQLRAEASEFKSTGLGTVAVQA